MIRSRAGLRLALVLAASAIGAEPARARSTSGSVFTSIRYGYALTLPPGWTLRQGDCAPYALALSADRSISITIRVTNGTLAAASLRQVEETTLRAAGRLQGAITYGTLRLRHATYQTADASTVSVGVTRDTLVAGVARNQHTYLVTATVSAPAGRGGQQNEKVAREILASVTFVKPALAGSFTCAGTGVSETRASPRPANVAAAVTPLVLHTSSTATQVRATRTYSATPSPLPSSAVSATATPSFTVTPSLTATPSPPATQTPSPSATPTWTATPTATATSTALPTATLTPAPTQTPVPSDIPTSGLTANGCAITPDQAAGESHLLALLNADRAGAGVAPLTLSPTLSAGARAHSCDMAQHNTLSHTGSDGSTPFQRIQATGNSFTAAGENIGTATGYGITTGIDLLNGQMMAEPLAPDTHHANIVDTAYHRVGIGVIYVNNTVWFTEDFVN